MEGMRKTILLFIVAFILACSLPAMAQSLRVVTLSSPPLAYEQDGHVTGFASELVREGLRRIGYEAEISIVPWKRAVFMARFGEADAVFYAVRSEERLQWFFYPDEHLVVEATVMLQRTGENVKIHPGKREYPKLRMGIGRGYYYGPKLKEFLEKAKFESVEEASTIEMNFAKLLEHRIDVFLADYYLARHFIEKNASGKLVEIIRTEEGFPMSLDSVQAYLAFSRKTMSQEITDQFSKTLHGMKRDGTYTQLLG